MTKLCPRGKAAAKRKFKVYPSAYANAYASKICAGKAKDPSGVKRKDWGPKKAKVGMAVTAGAQSGMGRLQKSGLMKANDGVYVEPPKPPRRIKGKGRQRLSTEYIKKKRAYDTLVGNDRKRRRMSDPRNKINPPQMKTGGDTKIKKVIKGLKKASKLHAAQAKTLKTIKVRGGGMAMQGTNFKGVF